MAPFTEVNKLMNILQVLATKMHFVLSQSITFFHSYSITIISHEKLFLFIDLSKPLFLSETVSRMG